MVLPAKDRMNCLVIGGMGFIGSHLVGALLKLGHRVRVFDRPRAVPAYPISLHPLLEHCEGDFAAPADVGPALEGMDVCFHLVSTTLPQSSNLGPLFDLNTNLIGTVRLLELAVAHRV